MWRPLDMAKPKGLGRGLDALMMGGSETGEKDTLQKLDVNLLQPGKYQPRTHMDEAALQELADSIRQQGLMQPVLVRPIPNLRYEIIAGERRWRAAKLAGLTEIECLVREVPDEAAIAMALIENIQREDLNPLEEARGIQRLVDEFSMTHEQAAQAVGRSRSAVSNLLRLNQLSPPVQELLMHSHLDMGHARALLALDPVQQFAVAQDVVKRELSVRQTEDLVRRLGSEQTQKPERRVDADVARLEQDLCDRLGTVVKIHAGARGQGRITIHYESLDALDGLIGRLQ